MASQEVNQKGIVLVTVIIFVMIISILAVSILFIMTGEARLTERQVKRIQASYAVQAGVQHYLNLLKSDSLLNPTPNPTNITVDDMTVNIEKFDDPAPAGSGCPDSASSDDPDCIKATTTY